MKNAMLGVAAGTFILVAIIDHLYLSSQIDSAKARADYAVNSSLDGHDFYKLDHKISEVDSRVDDLVEKEYKIVYDGDHVKLEDCETDYYGTKSCRLNK